MNISASVGMSPGATCNTAHVIRMTQFLCCAVACTRTQKASVLSEYLKMIRAPDLPFHTPVGLGMVCGQ